MLICFSKDTSHVLEHIQSRQQTPKHASVSSKLWLFHKAQPPRIGCRRRRRLTQSSSAAKKTKRNKKNRNIRGEDCTFPVCRISVLFFFFYFVLEFTTLSKSKQIIRTKNSMTRNRADTTEITTAVLVKSSHRVETRGGDQRAENANRHPSPPAPLCPMYLRLQVSRPVKEGDDSATSDLCGRPLVLTPPRVLVFYGA